MLTAHNPRYVNLRVGALRPTQSAHRVCSLGAQSARRVNEPGKRSGAGPSQISCRSSIDGVFFVVRHRRARAHDVAVAVGAVDAAHRRPVLVAAQASQRVGGELDRFCDAMIAIRHEIHRVEAGEWDADASPLRGAPHPAEDVSADSWARAYPRELAAYPLRSLTGDKYWPPVSRIDGAYGDRNVMCSCPPVSDNEEDAVDA